MPAGIIFPDLWNRAPIIPAKASDVPNCNRGRGGSCELKCAPNPNIAPKARPAPREGMEPEINYVHLSVRYVYG